MKEIDLRYLSNPELPPVTVGELVAHLLTLPQDQEIILYPKDHIPIDKYMWKRFHLVNVYQADTHVSIRF